MSDCKVKKRKNNVGKLDERFGEIDIFSLFHLFVESNSFYSRKKIFSQKVRTKYRSILPNYLYSYKI